MTIIHIDPRWRIESTPDGWAVIERREGVSRKTGGAIVVEDTAYFGRLDHAALHVLRSPGGDFESVAALIGALSAQADRIVAACAEVAP